MKHFFTTLSVLFTPQPELQRQRASALSPRDLVFQTYYSLGL